MKVDTKNRVSVLSAGENRTILRLLVLTQYQRVIPCRILAQLSATETCWLLSCHEPAELVL